MRNANDVMSETGVLVFCEGVLCTFWSFEGVFVHDSTESNFACEVYVNVCVFARLCSFFPVKEDIVFVWLHVERREYMSTAQIKHLKWVHNCRYICHYEAGFRSRGGTVPTPTQSQIVGF